MDSTTAITTNSAPTPTPSSNANSSILILDFDPFLPKSENNNNSENPPEKIEEPSQIVSEKWGLMVDLYDKYCTKVMKQQKAVLALTSGKAPKKSKSHTFYPYLKDLAGEDNHKVSPNSGLQILVRDELQPFEIPEVRSDDGGHSAAVFAITEGPFTVPTTKKTKKKKKKTSEKSDQQTQQQQQQNQQQIDDKKLKKKRPKSEMESSTNQQQPQQSQQILPNQQQAPISSSSLKKARPTNF